MHTHDTINSVLRERLGFFFRRSCRVHCESEMVLVFIVLCCFVNNIMICTVPALIWISGERAKRAHWARRNVPANGAFAGEKQKKNRKTSTARFWRCYINLSGAMFSLFFFIVIFSFSRCVWVCGCLGTANYSSVLFSTSLEIRFDHKCEIIPSVGLICYHKRTTISAATHSHTHMLVLFPAAEHANMAAEWTKYRSKCVLK